MAPPAPAPPAPPPPWRPHATANPAFVPPAVRAAPSSSRSGVGGAQNNAGRGAAAAHPAPPQRRASRAGQPPPPPSPPSPSPPSSTASSTLSSSLSSSYVFVPSPNNPNPSSAASHQPLPPPASPKRHALRPQAPAAVPARPPPAPSRSRPSTTARLIDALAHPPFTGSALRGRDVGPDASVATSDPTRAALSPTSAAFTSSSSSTTSSASASFSPTPASAPSSAPSPSQLLLPPPPPPPSSSSSYIVSQPQTQQLLKRDPSEYNLQGLALTLNRTLTPKLDPLTILRLGNFKRFNALLQHDPALLHACDRHGETVLHWAAIMGNLELARRYIFSPPTPASASHPRPSLDVQLSSPNNPAGAPSASTSGAASTFSFPSTSSSQLLAPSPHPTHPITPPTNPPTAVTTSTTTPAASATSAAHVPVLAVQSGQPPSPDPARSVASQLHTPNVDPRSRVTGQTPLMWATTRGHLVMMQFLIECGAQVAAQDLAGNTPLILAVQNQQLLAFHHLLELGGSRLLAMADHNGDTVAHWAAYVGLVPVLRLLRQSNAPLSEPDRRGFTPLHRAVQMGHREAAEVLLTDEHAAAALATKNADGHTPFELSLALRKPELAALLDADHASWQRRVTQLCTLAHRQTRAVTSGNAAALALLQLAIYVSAIWPHTAGIYPLLTMLVQVLAVLCLVLAATVRFSDPGRLKPGLASTVLHSILRRARPPVRGFPADGPNTVCSHCFIFRPLRSGHCDKCQACIERRSHHSAVLNVCIGQRTHRAYVLLLLCTCATELGLLLLALLVLHASRLSPWDGFGAFAAFVMSHWPACLTCTLCVCTTTLVARATAPQLRSIARNLTLHEQEHRSNIRHLWNHFRRLDGGEGYQEFNPFDKGPRANCAEFWKATFPSQGQLRNLVVAS